MLLMGDFLNQKRTRLKIVLYDREITKFHAAKVCTLKGLSKHSH